MQLAVPNDNLVIVFVNLCLLDITWELRSVTLPVDVGNRVALI